MICLSHFSKAFKQKSILEDVSIDFKESSFYALVGESGSGKTTLLKSISLLDPDYQGSLTIDDQDARHLKKTEAFRILHFSYIFSDSYLLDYLSIQENVFLPLYAMKKPISNEIFQEYAMRLGLTAVLNQKPVELSEGEKQRVSILRALLMNKPYLICDEPTSHLDPTNAKAILQLLRSLSHDMHKTVIVALHDYSSLSAFDRVLQFTNQKLIDYGK